MATITYIRDVDTDPNNTDTFVYVYTPNEPGLTTKTFTVERDVHYDVQAREAIFVGAELGYDASKYNVDGNGIIFKIKESNVLQPQPIEPIDVDEL